MLDEGIELFIFTSICIITEYNRVKIFHIRFPNSFLNDGFEFS